MNRYINRINKEIKEIKILLLNKTVFNNIHIINKFIILFNINYNKIKIILLPKYPFDKPHVFIDNIKYIDFLNKIDVYEFKKLKNIECCPCCDSILKNWFPIRKIKNIIKEIYNIINITQRIKERKNYLLIQNKYNIPLHIYTYL